MCSCCGWLGDEIVFLYKKAIGRDGLEKRRKRNGKGKRKAKGSMECGNECERKKKVCVCVWMCVSFFFLCRGTKWFKIWPCPLPFHSQLKEENPHPSACEKERKMYGVHEPGFANVIEIVDAVCCLCLYLIGNENDHVHDHVHDHGS